MTRTERNQYPAALLKDRHSRTGFNKNEDQRKQGAGAHNWGSRAQEGEYENQAGTDAADERAVFDMEGNDDVAPMKNDANHNDNNDNKQKSIDGLDIAAANANAGEGGIGHSPSDSMSSIDSAGSTAANANARPVNVGRRMSNVSDEERERARLYREGVMNKGGFDLAHIAKTSYGIAQSPPKSYTLGTSPTKTKAAMFQ